MLFEAGKVTSEIMLMAAAVGAVEIPVVDYEAKVSVSPKIRIFHLLSATVVVVEDVESM